MRLALRCGRNRTPPACRRTVAKSWRTSCSWRCSLAAKVHDGDHLCAPLGRAPHGNDGGVVLLSQALVARARPRGVHAVSIDAKLCDAFLVGLGEAECFEAFVQVWRNGAVHVVCRLVPLLEQGLWPFEPNRLLGRQLSLGDAHGQAPCSSTMRAAPGPYTSTLRSSSASLASRYAWACARVSKRRAPKRGLRHTRRVPAALA